MAIMKGESPTAGLKTISVDDNGKIDIGSFPALDDSTDSVSAAVTSLPSSIVISPTVTPNLTAYDASDNIGGKLTLTNAVASSGGTGILQEITVIDDDNEKAELYIIIFNANPTAATLTDDAAIVYSTDISKIETIVHIAATDYVTIGDAAIATVSNLGRVVQAVGSANLYAAIMCVGTPTYTAATDLQVKFKFLRD